MPKTKFLIFLLIVALTYCSSNFGAGNTLGEAFAYSAESSSTPNSGDVTHVGGVGDVPVGTPISTSAMIKNDQQGMLADAQQAQEVVHQVETIAPDLASSKDVTRAVENNLWGTKPIIAGNAEITSIITKVEANPYKAVESIGSISEKDINSQKVREFIQEAERLDKSNVSNGDSAKFVLEALETAKGKKYQELVDKAYWQNASTWDRMRGKQSNKELKNNIENIIKERINPIYNKHLSKLADTYTPNKLRLLDELKFEDELLTLQVGMLNDLNGIKVTSSDLRIVDNVNNNDIVNSVNVVAASPLVGISGIEAVFAEIWQFWARLLKLK